MKAHIRTCANLSDNQKASIFGIESKQADGSSGSAKQSKLHVVEGEFLPFDEEKLHKFHRTLLHATLSLNLPFR